MKLSQRFFNVLRVAERVNFAIVIQAHDTHIWVGGDERGDAHMLAGIPDDIPINVSFYLDQFLQSIVHMPSSEPDVMFDGVVSLDAEHAELGITGTWCRTIVAKSEGQTVQIRATDPRFSGFNLGAKARTRPTSFLTPDRTQLLRLLLTRDMRRQLTRWNKKFKRSRGRHALWHFMGTDGTADIASTRQEGESGVTFPIPLVASTSTFWEFCLDDQQISLLPEFGDYQLILCNTPAGSLCVVAHDEQHDYQFMFTLPKNTTHGF